MPKKMYLLRIIRGIFITISFLWIISSLNVTSVVGYGHGAIVTMVIQFILAAIFWGISKIFEKYIHIKYMKEYGCKHPTIKSFNGFFIALIVLAFIRFVHILSII
jgi:hypothetical protein